VVGADHEGVDAPGTAPGSPRQLVLEPVAVVVIADNVPAGVAAAHHVVDRAEGVGCGVVVACP
jgi:hypothetical protein